MTKKRMMMVVILILLLVGIFSSVLVGTPVLRKNGKPYLTSCTSVALFGRLEIAGVDRVVISSKDKSLTITDEDLVAQIVDKTKVANWAYNTGCGNCDVKRWKIELYAGDTLKRSMEWIEEDIVKVYDWDLAHWVFPVEIQSEQSMDGYAHLSQELADRLSELFMNAE